MRKTRTEKQILKSKESRQMKHTARERRDKIKWRKMNRMIMIWWISRFIKQKVLIGSTQSRMILCFQQGSITGEW